MTQNVFDNEQYEILARDIVGDAFYSDQSYRGKISRERQYAELILRKLLDLNPNEHVTIGKKDITQKIQALPDSAFILKAVRAIQPFGNDTTHTQVTRDFTKQDYDTVTDSLFDLLSSLLINYFSKYRFGSKPRLLKEFSLLPPLIRRKVLMYLYDKDSNNVAVIDKLVLAILKADGKDEALKWIEAHRDKLSSQLPIDSNFYEKVKREHGEEYVRLLCEPSLDMYQVCVNKVESVGRQLEKQGVLYLDFESAKPYYEKNCILNEDDDEIREFNDIMKFLYLGRRGNDIVPDEPVIVINLL